MKAITNTSLKDLPIKKIGRHKYITTEEIQVKIARLKKVLTIPKGFVWDGYSCVPDFAVLPALVHDYLFIYKEIDGEPVTLWQANRIFFDLMRKSGGWTKAFSYLYYFGVTAFGWIPWYF
jgi:uncharacterized protein Usg